MPEPLFWLLAAVAVLLFARWALRVLRRYALLIVAVIAAVVVLSGTGGDLALLLP